jgi:hypothetical protein
MRDGKTSVLKALQLISYANAAKAKCGAKRPVGSENFRADQKLFLAVGIICTRCQRTREEPGNARGGCEMKRGCS